MKKIYNSPSSSIVSILSEAPILSSSNPLNDMNIGFGIGTDQGHNALGNGKDIWGNEDIW